MRFSFRKFLGDYIISRYSKISEEHLNSHSILVEDFNKLRKENQSLSGRIKILEDQQEIMHNFLVEINKYLAKKSGEENGLSKHEAGTEG